MEVLQVENAGTGMTFKNHLKIHKPLLQHLTFKAKESVTITTQKKTSNETKPSMTSTKKLPTDSIPFSIFLRLSYPVLV